MNNTQDFQGNIILFPEIEAITKEVEKLRTQLSMLFLERDNLLYQECKNIEMEYMLAVGGLEYKLYEIECKIRRLIRKIQLIQAKKNRQEKIILVDIEEALDNEFAEYQENLSQQMERMNAALERSRGQELTPVETKELKKIYRKIVKALHPDLHPDLSDVKLQLFYNAVDCYQSGDLNGLKIVEMLVSDPNSVDEKPDKLEGLIKEKERLTKLLETVKERIDAIKLDFPYNVKEFVHNPEKIAVRKLELEEQIKEYQEVLSAYQTKIAEMLR